MLHPAMMTAAYSTEKITALVQATGDTGTQWILDLCNGIVKEGSIPDDWYWYWCGTANLQRQR